MSTDQPLTPDQKLAARCKDGPLHIFHHEIHKLKALGCSDEAIATYCRLDRAPLNRKDRRAMKARQRLESKHR